MNHTSGMPFVYHLHWYILHLPQVPLFKSVIKVKAKYQKTINMIKEVSGNRVLRYLKLIEMKIIPGGNGDLGDQMMDWTSFAIGLWLICQHRRTLLFFKKKYLSSWKPAIIQSGEHCHPPTWLVLEQNDEHKPQSICLCKKLWSWSASQCLTCCVCTCSSIYKNICVCSGFNMLI